MGELATSKTPKERDSTLSEGFNTALNPYQQQQRLTHRVNYPEFADGSFRLAGHHVLRGHVLAHKLRT
jgi:hypothetical protein